MAKNFAITGSVEILRVAEAVAREKGINKESVMEALSEAVVSAARKKYGFEQHIHCTIDQKTGEILLFRDRTVVEKVENFYTEIDLDDARKVKPEAVLGDMVSDPVPPIDFGRVTSQTFKQVVIQKVRDAERQKQYEDFKDRIGEIVTGVVKRIEYGNLIIDFGKTETLLPRDQIIPREVYRPGDRIRAYIVDVRRDNRGQQIVLSRTNPGFLAELFKQEVPEIYDGIINIKAVARDPGSRAKCAVYASDSSLDPVGACIGPRGARVTAVHNELQGEKIDIIQWSPDLATFAVNALTAKTKDMVVEVSKIVIHEDKRLIEAVVPDDHLSLSIGRRGQNVRLASQLIGWNIDVISDSEESERSQKEFANISQLFATALDVEEIIGQLLASEGFTSVEEVAYVDESDLLSIEGFDADLVSELRRRAEEYLEEQEKQKEEQWKAAGVSPEMATLPHVTADLMLQFARREIKTKDDLAELSRDEFHEIIPNSELEDAQIDEMIMAARAHWFNDEDKKSGVK
jgi:transcription termination/antitermination protein NusA